MRLVLRRISSVTYVQDCASQAAACAESVQANRKSWREFPASRGRGCYCKVGGHLRTTVTEAGQIGTPPFPLGPSNGQRESVMDLAKTLKIDSVSRLHLSPPLCISPEQTV